MTRLQGKGFCFPFGCIVLCLLLALGAGAPAQAATRYMTAAGGSQAWDTGTTANWATNSGGPYNTAWANYDEAVFEGTGGTVNLSGPYANRLTFSVDGYTLAGTTLNMGNPGGTNFAVSAGCSALISSTIAQPYTTGFYKTGTGSLTLTGVGSTANNLQSYQGVLLFSNATMTVAGDFHVGRNAFQSNDVSLSTVVVSGGAVTINGANLVLGQTQNGTNKVAQLTQTGGVITHTGTFMGIGNGGGVSQIDISGGVFSNTAAGSMNLGVRGNSTLNISQTGQVTLAGLTFGHGGTAGASSTVNLDGGTFTVGSVGRGSGTATFNFNGGTLKARVNSSAFMQGLTTANVKDGGALIDTAGFSIGIGQALLNGGAGGLTKVGAGTLTLSGANTYAGATLVTNGELVVTGTYTGSGEHRVSGGGKLGGSGTIGAPVLVTDGAAIENGTGGLFGTLTAASLLVSNATVSATVGSSPSIRVTGTNAFACAGTNAVVVSGVSSTGQFVVVDYAGTLDAPSFASLTLSLPHRTDGQLVDNVANSSLDLVVTNADTLRWTGAAGGAWDVNTTTNWQFVSDGAPAAFQQSDRLLFDDSATNFGVTAAAGVAPASMTVSNSVTYTIGGGSIGGPGGLRKSGPGLLVLAGTNLYGGATVVEGGTLSVAVLANGGSASPIGASGSSASNWVLTGATLLYTGPTAGIDRGLTLGAGGATVNVSVAATTLSGSGLVTGSGGLTKTGPGTLTLNADNDYAGATVVNAGVLVLNSPNFNTYRGGGLFINNGSTLRISRTGGANRYDFTGKTFTFDAGGGNTLDTSSGLNFVSWAPGNSYVTSGGAQSFIGGTSGLNINGGVTNTFSIARGTGASDLKILPPIWNGGAVVKSGPGILEMTATNNSYSGGTYVNEGMLLINGGNQGAGGINVGAGAYLWGTGRVTGSAVVVSSNGSVGVRSPQYGGTFTVGDLTLIAGARLSGLANGTNPTVRATGTLTTAAPNPVDVWFLATPATGTTHKILSYAGAIGGEGAPAFTLGQVMLRGGTGYITNNAAEASIDFVFTGSTNQALIWTGAESSRWQAGLGTNWLSGATPDLFFQGDAVTFDDTGLGVSNVILSGTLWPASVAVNSSGDYSLGGAGSLAGSATLTKGGAGTLTLNNSGNNSYTGATTVNGGVLAVGGSFTGDGAIQGSIIVNSNGTFRLLQANILANTCLVTANAGGVFDENGKDDVVGLLAGDGLITNLNGNLTLDLGGTSTFGGTISGSAGLILRSNLGGTQVFGGTASLGSLRVGDTANTGTLAMTGGTFNVSGTFLIAQPAGSKGTVAVSGGAFAVLGGSTLGDYGMAQFTQSGGTVTMNGSPYCANNGGSVTLDLGGGSFTANSLVQFGIRGNATLNITNAADVTLNGGISMGYYGLGGYPTITTINLAGGSLTAGSGGAGDFLMGQCNQGGVTRSDFNQTGGTFLYRGGWMGIANMGGVSTLNLSGGTFSTTGAGLTLGVRGNSALNVSGTASVTLPYVAIFHSDGVTGGGKTGVVTLAGGTLTVGFVSRNTALSTGVFNFDGGTLKPSASTATFMGGLSAANVGAGGAIVDTGGYDVTISQGLLNGGAGGLTKSGAGILALSGTNTYVGATTVSAGTLTIAAGGTLTGTSNVVVSAGTLELQTVGNFAINDTVPVEIFAGATMALGADVKERIQTLRLGGVQMSPGTWGSSASGAEHVSDVYFSGAGYLIVQAGPVTGGVLTIK